MEPTPIYNLLEKVHEFYPVGMKMLSGYPGEKRIMDIIEKKITAIINEEQNPGSALFNSFKSSAADYLSFDYSSRQFPSYTMGFRYEEEISGDLNRITQIVFTISLLCDYYTYFIHDFYRISGQTSLSQRRNVYPIDSVSVESHISFEKIEPIIKRVILDIEKYFPQHTYVNHLQLFSSKVDEAVPYGQTASYTPSSPYSIYHFLFDGSFAEKPFVRP
jgi:hypothetical protein